MPKAKPDTKRASLPRVAQGVTLRKSPRETPEEFERRNQQFNDFKEFKMKNFPRVNLVFTEEPLLLTNIVKYPQRSCNQQRRQLLPQMIFTHRSLRPSVTTTATDVTVTVTDTDSSESILGKSTTGIDTSTSTVTSRLTATALASELTATTTDTSTSLASQLTATTTDTSTSPVRPTELNDNELMKKLQERNPKIDLSVYLIPQKTHLDFSQYLIQKPLHHQVDADSETIVAGILRDLLDNLDFGEDNENQECENNSSETGIKVTKFQRFRRSLKSLKTRIVRAMTPLTSCFSLKYMHTTD